MYRLSRTFQGLSRTSMANLKHLVRASLFPNPPTAMRCVATVTTRAESTRSGPRAEPSTAPPSTSSATWRRTSDGRSFKEEETLANQRISLSKTGKSIKKGFGLLDEDLWLGNEKIFALTNQGHYAIRFVMEHINGATAYADYDTFYIDSEDQNYKLHISGYSGTAGDSMTYHDKMPFTTADRENSPANGRCGRDWTGGWWFNDCHKSNFNGIHEVGRYECKVANGVEWNTFAGFCTSLKAVAMKIRPVPLL